ncbi:unnamed protein product [Calicophoron daubneyi]|uniref:Uncharacterized protein n=1 Tax=Calicophoron daubneyi TaxID=300641 RepID=A0AAV2T0D4_CALDB
MMDNIEQFVYMKSILSRILWSVYFAQIGAYQVVSVAANPTTQLSVEVSNGTTETVNATNSTTEAEKSDHLAAILIAVSLLALLTVCMILLILRTVNRRHHERHRTKSKDKRTAAADGKADDEIIRPGNATGTYAAPPGSVLVSGVRDTPTRKGNKKWYDSTAIPFMDEMSYSNENLYGR